MAGRTGTTAVEADIRETRMGYPTTLDVLSDREREILRAALETEAMLYEEREEIGQAGNYTAAEVTAVLRRVEAL